jgi:hypothetical protein
MALFEFELARVEDIVPWDTSAGPSLSWFALTDGQFRMPVGDQVLFEYSDEIRAHWGTTARNADYQIAAFAREMLGSVAAVATRLPERIERLAAHWDRLCKLQRESELADDGDDAEDLAYAAWRWLGERTPWSGYLVANPNFQFVRVGNDVRIHWDNRDLAVDGHPVWTAQHGEHAMRVESFVQECRDFVQRLLIAMDDRIAAIEAGAVRAQAVLEPGLLRVQQETWRTEFETYSREYEPDIAWQKAERALEMIAKRKGLPF